jgi:hypothetical protein
MLHGMHMLGMKVPGAMRISKRKSSPPVSRAVLRKVIRCFVIGSSMIFPA